MTIYRGERGLQIKPRSIIIALFFPRRSLSARISNFTTDNSNIITGPGSF